MTVSDQADFLIGERIDEVLKECRSRNSKFRAKEEKCLKKMDKRSREQALKLVEALLEERYEDLKTAYCAGLEDGMRIAREVLSV